MFPWRRRRMRLKESFMKALVAMKVVDTGCQGRALDWGGRQDFVSSSKAIWQWEVWICMSLR